MKIDGSLKKYQNILTFEKIRADIGDKWVLMVNRNCKSSLFQQLLYFPETSK